MKKEKEKERSKTLGSIDEWLYSYLLKLEMVDIKPFNLIFARKEKEKICLYVEKKSKKKSKIDWR